MKKRILAFGLVSISITMLLAGCGSVNTKPSNDTARRESSLSKATTKESAITLTSDITDVIVN